MNDSHSQQLNILLIFIAVLFTAIFVPITLSLLRKNKSTQSKTIDAIPAPDADQKIATTDQITSKEKIPVENKTASSAAKKDEAGDLASTATLYEAMSKTQVNFFGRIKNAFNSTDKKKVRDDIEEILYTSDLGPKTVEKLLSRVDQELSSSDLTQISKIKEVLSRQMHEILFDIHESQKNAKLVSDLIPKQTDGPTVLLIVGVNGAGKTTSIGKITAQLAHQGFKILVAAGDTFRAAAGGQLKVWTDRAQNSKGHVDIFWPQGVNDPSAVAFDALSKAKAQNYDFVILDTAGRLHTQGHLMDELKKVKRVMTKVIPTAPHETWIVLDANSGQNAINQATEFDKALEITGVILTKMDGTAKGGVALGVVDQLDKPIRLVGLGEKIGDLKVFEPKAYIDSILG